VRAHCYLIVFNQTAFQTIKQQFMVWKFPHFMTLNSYIYSFEGVHKLDDGFGSGFSSRPILALFPGPFILNHYYNK
jgi:hypothetical protein